MKTLITILLVSVCSITFGQPPKTEKKDSLHKEIKLTAYMKMRIENYKKASEAFQKLTLEYQEFLFIAVNANDIDTDRIFQDSIKFTQEKILLVLKPKKK